MKATMHRGRDPTVRNETAGVDRRQRQRVEVSRALSETLLHRYRGSPFHRNIFSRPVVYRRL